MSLTINNPALLLIPIGVRNCKVKTIDEIAFQTNLLALNAALSNFQGKDEMTKAELIAKIANADGITKSQAEKAVDGFVSAVSAALSASDKITLVGFGTFSVGERSQREGRNPRTGEKIEIPESKVVKFKAGKTLCDKVK
jgi:DNA-binding protein HU-beta